jgi:hypothetical protein
MEHNVQRLLNDKLYDKRKVGALEYVACLALAAISHLLRFLVFVRRP